jgi:hypothetical protein
MDKLVLRKTILRNMIDRVWAPLHCDAAALAFFWREEDYEEKNPETEGP